jgi:hypothetical protein
MLPAFVVRRRRRRGNKGEWTYLAGYGGGDDQLGGMLDRMGEI